MARLQHQGFIQAWRIIVDDLKTLGQDLWRNKPLLIGFVALIGLAVYILVRNSQANATSSTADSSPATGAVTSAGTFVEGSGYTGHKHPTTPVSSAPSAANITPAPTFPTTSGTPNVPIMVSTAPVVTSNPVKIPILPKANPTASQPKAVTVTPWGTQYGSLFDIAKSVYGNGNLWPKIYNANKNIIGNNPNLIRPGQNLVIPS